MLSDMISEKLIRIDVEAADWKEAIRESAQPLLEEDKITQGYIDKIIEIAEETGPYIVVAEHIALPHAPSKYGAKELAMGITVLRTPIEFGNEANVPVKYLFCMSAKDSNSHLESLAQLVDLLEDSQFYKVLDTAKEASEILDYIKNNENKNTEEE